MREHHAAWRDNIWHGKLSSGRARCGAAGPAWVWAVISGLPIRRMGFPVAIAAIRHGRLKHGPVRRDSARHGAAWAAIAAGKGRFSGVALFFWLLSSPYLFDTGTGMSQKHTTFQKVALGLAAVFGALTVAMIVAFGGSKEEIRDPVRDAEITEIKLQRMARDFVSKSLKDPSSAEFRNQVGVCGEVNAKNSFGGYSGFTRFIAAGEDLVFMQNDPALERGAFQESWDRFCK